MPGMSAQQKMPQMQMHPPIQARDKDGNLLDNLRSMQQMERETQETLSKFMSALSHRNETDYAALLEDKILELQQAEADNLRLRGEMDQYENRIEQLQANEDKILREKGQVHEEKLRAGKAATQADHIIKNLQAQMRAAEQKHAQDLDIKGSMLRNLEEENVRSKVHSDEAQTRLEAFTHEAAELHSAMASLHGELAAQQRELDESKERDQRNARQKKELNVRLDEKETELGRIKGERRNLEARVTDLDKKLNDAVMRDDQQQLEGRSQLDLVARERDNVSGSLAKMSHKLRQQTDTCKELNSALNRMRIEMSNLQEEAARDGARAEAAVRDVQSLQIVVQSLERSKTEADALVQRLEQDKLGTGSDLSQANERVTALLADQRRLQASADKLERTRTELTVELACRSKELQALKKTYEQALLDTEDSTARSDTERLGKERALERIGQLEGDLERCKGDLREHVENVEAQARQLRESERMREQALETSRAQQRENANRIIEFSQKNAKLSSEVSARDDEIASLRRNQHDEHSRGVESGKERDDAKNQYLATKVRLQALEDEHELSVAKYEATKAETEQLRAQLKSEMRSREVAMTEILEKHDTSVAQLQERLEAETEEKLHISEANRKQAEEKLRSAIAKEKEAHTAHLADSEVQRAEEAEVQRARLGTLAKAMEGLQAELRDESAKNGNLSQELSVLKELADVGNSEMQERVAYVERERGRERSRLEGQLTDLKEQLRQQLEQKQQRDQLTATIEQQLSREREAKFAAMQRVRSAEDEANSLTNQVDTLSEESVGQKKAVRDSERKLALAIQTKDAEIVRLTRRNEVLGEAVTRLTSSGSSSTSSASQGGGKTPSSASASKALGSLGKFFTAGVSASPGEDNLSHLTGWFAGNGDSPGHAPTDANGSASVNVAADATVVEAPAVCTDPLGGKGCGIFLSKRLHSAPMLRSITSLSQVADDASLETVLRPFSAGDAEAQGVEDQSGLLSPLGVPEGFANCFASPKEEHQLQQQSEYHQEEEAEATPASAEVNTDMAALVREAVLAASAEEEPQPETQPPVPLQAHSVFPSTPPCVPATERETNTGGSTGSLKEKLQAEIIVGRDLQLPYSPKRGASAPSGRSAAAGKENVHKTVSEAVGQAKGQGQLPPGKKAAPGVGAVTAQGQDKPKPGAGGRMKRASEFMKARQSQSARTAKKGPSF